MSDHHDDLPEPGDDGLAQTASVLSRALADRAAEVEPGPNAYANLAAKVATASSRQEGFFSSWSVGRLGAVAATGVVVAVAAVGAVAVTSGGGGSSTGIGEISSADGSDDSSIEADPALDGEGGEIEGDTTIDSSLDPSVPSGGEQTPATPDMISDLTLARPTQVDAIEAFIDLLGVQFIDFEVTGDRASVWTYREGSTDRGLDVATLQLAPVDLGGESGWIVAEATSDLVEIDQPAPSTAVSGQSELAVSGRGTGFEATLGLQLISATDGSVLVESSVMAGNFGELAGFETTVPLVGTERAWLVVTSSGGASGVAEPFAAVPVSFEGVVDDTDYVVVRVGDDDPDGGLVLRAGPSTSTSELAVVPPGGVVNRRPGAYPTRNGATVWWPVRAGSAEGWMSSAFLADPGPASDDAYRDWTRDLLGRLADPDRLDPFTPVSPMHGFTLHSNGTRVRFTAEQMQSGAAWGSVHPDLGRSPLDAVGLPVDLPSVEIAINQAQFAEASSQGLADGFFGGLPSTSVSYEGTDGEPRHLHFFFAIEPGNQIVVIGAIVE
jgi:hypothetical protein